MPRKAFSATRQEASHDVKRCPPFIDAMTYGFLMPLICDLTVENGEFTWDLDLPAASIASFRALADRLP